MVSASLILALVVVANPAFADFSYGDGCLFDGKIYQKGQKIEIKPCLGQMECLGDNALGPIEEATNCQTKREAPQFGCLFDGQVYDIGQRIEIKPCLAYYTCLGDGVLGDYIKLDGVCPDDN
ncbi:hypothetical protein EGW08_017105 [Elysia chlorotica]|uniref:Single domain-containing protein n=1 Tax=Elysia chlorotica TaxID=188477 RepID=A0A3S0ZHP6_ELYCH|nr:hypothetical protein EGW08_017105 [Elysia chlorotica]